MASQPTADRQLQVKDAFMRCFSADSSLVQEQMLAQLASENPEIEAEVRSLLGSSAGAKAIEQVFGFVSHEALAETNPSGQPSTPSVGGRSSIGMAEGPGTLIGPYELLEQIGQGGMGSVFMAQQSSPIKRRVALKIIKPGMDTQQVVARFEAERQALALMDHPNIAKVLDAGTTQPGRPYFVMELVKGIPITEYCDREQLKTKDRLRLFIDLCLGVQHAHQKGIIHRDLKPSNVLVTLHDSKPIVKIIDFGIAKAVNQELTDKTLFTHFSQMIGTPLYMSPEQADLSGLDVDTRSDVYSLGVLLYELLTGTTPFDKELLKGVGLDEIRRMIREDEPPRPSQRIGQNTGTLKAANDSTLKSKAASSELRAQRELKGELDWIVMKALEKERNRRYESASSFGADVNRFLEGKPVQACPPAFLYVAKKYALRNRGAFLAAVGMLVMLLVGLGVAFTQFRRAIVAEAESQKSLKIAAQKATVAESRLHIAETAIDDMYTQFAANWLSQQSGLSKVEREFLQKALSAYESLARTDDSDSMPTVGSLRAMLQLAIIHSNLGESNENEKVLNKLISQADFVLDRNPANSGVRILSARGHSMLAYFFLKRSQHKDKLKHADIAISQIEMVDSTTITDVTDRLQMSKCFQAIANVLTSEEIRKKEAASAAASCVMEAKRLVDEFPKKPEYKLLLAGSLSVQGQQQLWWGTQNDECARSYEQALEILTQLEVESPGTPQILSERITPQHNLGTVYGRLKQDDKIYPMRLNQVELLESLTSRFPERLNYQEELCEAYNSLALCERRRGNAERADTLSQRALGVVTTLADRFPDRFSAVRLVGQILLRKGSLAKDERDFKKAIEPLEQARTRLVRYLSSKPEELEFYTIAAQVHRDLAVAYLLQEPSDPTKAAEIAREMLEYRSRNSRVDLEKNGNKRSPGGYEMILCTHLASLKLLDSCAVESVRNANPIDEQSLESNRTLAAESRAILEQTVNEWVTSTKERPELIQALMKSADSRDAHKEHRKPQTIDHLFYMGIVESHRRLFAGYVDQYGDAQNFPEDLARLALLLSSTKDYSAEAQKLLEQCRRQALASPNDTRLQQSLAWVLFRCSRWQECIDILRTPSQSSRFENGFIASMSLWQLNRQDEAKRILNKTNEWLTKNLPILTEQEKNRVRPQPNIEALLRLQWDAEQMLEK